MYAGAYTSVIGRDKPNRQTERTETMNPLITSADQLTWINLNKLPLNDRRRIEAPPQTSQPESMTLTYSRSTSKPLPTVTRESR